jgi:hypothetical protein
METPDGVITGTRTVSGVEQGKQCVVCLNDCTTSPDYVDKQHYQRQHQQDMNEPTDCVATNNAKQPQNQQDYKNRPKHFVSLLLSTTPKFRLSSLAQKQSW